MSFGQRRRINEDTPPPRITRGNWRRVQNHFPINNNNNNNENNNNNNNNNNHQGPPPNEGPPNNNHNQQRPRSPPRTGFVGAPGNQQGGPSGSGAGGSGSG